MCVGKVKIQRWKEMHKIQSILCSNFLSEQIGDSMLIINESDHIHKAISGFVIIHPMVKLDKKFQKSNGHTVLTQCWRIRTEKVLCEFVPRTPRDFCVYVEDKK